MQIIPAREVHPVIVVGSGASGGMAAWNLTQKGIDVLLLDAGDKFDRAKYWTMFSHGSPRPHGAWRASAAVLSRHQKNSRT